MRNTRSTRAYVQTRSTVDPTQQQIPTPREVFTRRGVWRWVLVKLVLVDRAIDDRIVRWGRR